MAISRESDTAIGSIDNLRKQAHDRAIATLSQNLDNMDKQQLLSIFSKLIQDMEHHSNELNGMIINSNNEKLAVEYAQSISSYIRRIDQTLDSELIQLNQQKDNSIDTPVSENALPGNVVM